MSFRTPLLVLMTVACATALVTTAAPAGAQPAPGGNGKEKDTSRVEARRLLRAGNAAYERGNFSAALAKFEQAEATFPSARIQFNIGQALRELGRPVDATVAFETFLDKADRITTQERKVATAALEKLDPQVARITVATSLPEVAVTIGGVDRGKTPLAKPVVVAPGTHEITLGRTGYRPLRESVTVAGGETRRANLELVPLPPAPTPAPAPVSSTTEFPRPAEAVTPVPAAPPQALPPQELGVTQGQAAPSTGKTQRTVGVSLLVASAALAVGGAVFMGAAWSRYNDAHDNGCAGSCESAADQVDTRALWSKLLFGAAAASGVGGAAVLLTAPSPPDGQTARGMMVVGRGTF